MSKIIAEQLRSEILSALISAPGPLTARELYDRCESAEDAGRLSAQLGFLKLRGRIVNGPDRAPTKITKGVKPVPTYRLPEADQIPLAPDEADRLATALEADLTHYQPDPEGDETDIGPPPAFAATAGDEFERTSAGCCGRCAPKPKTPRPALVGMVWRAGGKSKGTIALDMSGPRPRLTTQGVATIDADLLLEIADMIETRYGVAA